MHRLCKDVYRAGCIPQLCQLVAKSPTLHSSCLRILVAMVTKTEDVTEVRKHLPIDSLCKLLNSEPEVQVCVLCSALHLLANWVEPAARSGSSQDALHLH